MLKPVRSVLSHLDTIQTHLALYISCKVAFIEVGEQMRLSIAAEFALVVLASYCLLTSACAFGSCLLSGAIEKHLHVK